MWKGSQISCYALLSTAQVSGEDERDEADQHGQQQGEGHHLRAALMKEGEKGERKILLEKGGVKGRGREVATDFELVVLSSSLSSSTKRKGRW